LVHVRIVSLSVDAASNQPVIILKPVDDEESSARLLPIWIGHPEAASILLALQSIEPPRPMTHDLLSNIVSTLGHQVARVEITRLEAGTFYAAIFLEDESGTVVIDARPSDSIALAVRTGSPIYVAEQVLDEAAVTADQNSPSEDEEAQVQQFRDFLESVDPRDFQG